MLMAWQGGREVESKGRIKGNWEGVERKGENANHCFWHRPLWSTQNLEGGGWWTRSQGSLSASLGAPSFTSCLILGKLLNLIQLKNGEAQGLKTGPPNLRTPDIFSVYTASSNPCLYNGPLVMNTVINNFPDGSWACFKIPIVKEVGRLLQED